MKKQYKATIITPFHNTDLSIFQTTIDSVLCQSIGFENIEWIIVLHNCGQEYIDGVRKKLGSYENVVLKELNNSARSASSPRNYGLNFVTSPYIEFLDSDDTIKPDTVETCLKAMEKHHADVVVFRMAYVRQNESVVSVITDITLWDPLKKEIVLTGRDTTARPELYSTINFCTHNRFFRAAFLNKHHIRFDEQITMAEDAYFTLSCYTQASKIVVLPQFVGHSYFVNSTSAVQSLKKTPEQILHYSYGFKKMFDLLLEHNAYYNHFFLTILEAYVNFGIHCPEFTAQNWKTLQDDMRLYAMLITPPPVNKFYTREQGQLVYEFVRNAILDPVEIKARAKNFRNGASILIHALKKNEATDFGTHYGFSQIHSIQEFRKKIPVQTYDDYNRLVELSANVGESQLITREPIAAYSSAFGFVKKGTSLPMADSLCTSMGNSFLNSFSGEKTFLIVGSLPKKAQANDGAYEDSLTSIILRSGIGELSLGDVAKARGFTASPELLFSQESDQTYYLNLLIALRNQNVTEIYAANSWILLNFLNILHIFVEDLCRDIAEGTVSHGNEASRELGERFSSFLRKKPERAEVILRAFQGDTGDILPTIWPNLKRIVARNGANCNVFSRQVSPWCEKIPLVSGDFYTPFGILGHGIDQANTYDLAIENAFYEFLPINGKAKTAPVLRTDCKVGQIYELVVTNEYGIYRLATGVFIRPLAITEDGMRFEEVMRPLIVHNVPVLTGEALEDTLNELLGGNLRDFYYYYDLKNRCLSVVVAADGNYGKDLGEQLTEKLHTKLLPGAEAVLKDVNPCHVFLTGGKNFLKPLTRLFESYRAAPDSYIPEHYIVSEDIAKTLLPDLKNPSSIIQPGKKGVKKS